MATGTAFGWQVENASGTPVSGAKIYTYKRATTTPQATYTDSAITVPAANPIIADAAGWFNAYLNPALDYTVTIKSADDSITYQTRDYYASTGAGSGGNSYNVVDTLAELVLIEGDDSEDTVFMLGRTAAGDGGSGQFRWVTGDQSANVSADTLQGLWVAPTAASTGASGAWRRVVSDNEYVWDWWGTTAAALSAAFSALGSTGGVVRARGGGDYTLSTQVTCDKNFATLDIRGCFIRPRFTTGAAFKFGNGSTLRQQIAVIGDGGTFIDGGSGGSAPAHPLFEVRGVRGFTTRGIFATDIWGVIKWGDPTDTVHSSWWNDLDCDWNLRSNANGGHGDAVQADGSLGRWVTNSSYEGNSSAVSGTQAVFKMTSAHMSSASAGDRRFDELARGAGSIWKGFDHGLFCTDSRLVNYHEDTTARTDDMQSWAHLLTTAASATQGGGEQLSFNGIYGGLPEGGGPRIVSGDATFTYKGMNFGIETQGLKAHALTLVTSGSGTMRGVTVSKLTCNEFDPDDASQDVLNIDGNIEGVFDFITLTGKSGATHDARYVVYNNTATARRVKIGANVTWDAVNTAPVYDPNIGDLSIGRFCALRADGSPRGGPVHMGPFSINNIAASVTGGDIGIRNDTLAVLSAVAFDRCRVIGMTASLLGTASAGNLTINANPNASGADTNLQISISSADGANPRKRVSYLAGTASIAAAGALRVLYTTDASWSPTTSDLVVYQIVQEM